MSGSGGDAIRGSESKRYISRTHDVGTESVVASALIGFSYECHAKAVTKPSRSGGCISTVEFNMFKFVGSKFVRKRVVALECSVADKFTGVGCAVFPLGYHSWFYFKEFLEA